MVGCNVIAADTDAEARRLFTSAQQSFTNMLRNARGKLPPPIDDIDAYWEPHEKAQASVDAGLLLRGLGRRRSGAGSERFIAETGADELMVASAIYDQAARIRSYEMLAEVAAGARAEGGGVSETPPDPTKLTRTKQRWAQEGRFLTGRTARAGEDRLPPGQHLVRDWPVLDLGVQPKIATGAVGAAGVRRGRRAGDVGLGGRSSPCRSGAR